VSDFINLGKRKHEKKREKGREKERSEHKEEKSREGFGELAHAQILGMRAPFSPLPISPLTLYSLMVRARFIRSLMREKPISTSFLGFRDRCQ